MSTHMAVRAMTPEGTHCNVDGWHEFLEVVGSIAFMRFGDVFFTHFYWEPQVCSACLSLACVRMPVCVCLSGHLSVSVFVYLCIRVCMYPLIHLSTHPLIHLSPSIHPANPQTQQAHGTFSVCLFQPSLVVKAVSLRWHSSTRCDIHQTWITSNRRSSPSAVSSK